MKLENIAKQKDFERGRDPKVMVFDLEISPLLAYTFGAYEANAQKIERVSQIISYAYSINNGPIKVKALPDFKGYKPGVSNLDDKALVNELYEVMSGVDMVVGHNIKKFDMKHANGRFIYHDLQPLKKLMVEDTLFMAKKYFKFAKNNLDYLCEQLGIGTKTDKKYGDLIWGCIDGDMKMWNTMKKYNKQDVAINQKLYEKLSPWHGNHSNLNLIKRGGQLCKICLANNRPGDDIRMGGTSWGKTFGRQIYRCNIDGHAWRGERLEKESEKIDQTNI